MSKIRLLLVLVVVVAGGLWAAGIGGGPPRLRGAAEVIDGDTIRLDTGGETVVVRLYGIDAAERGQSCRDARGQRWDCGAAATAALVRHIGEARVACTPRDVDRYSRTVASCRAGRRDLGAAMVSEGMAWALANYAPDYLPAEAAARKAARGIWAGRAEMPSSFRARRRTAGQGPPNPACRIKGNISAQGRIYHLPGSPTYARTRIDTAAGERWFCSERQAREAGWRAAAG